MNRQYMRQLQKVQNQMAKVQEELAKATVETSAGGGAVKVVITGQQRIESIKISPEAVDPQDVELLEDMVLAAVNDAIEKSQAMATQRLGALTGGLNIPGLR
ncbi:MAG: YbaB/EbfC family nucleoid-associated protein [Dehalococcoidia bacterium]